MSDWQPIETAPDYTRIWVRPANFEQPGRAPFTALLSKPRDGDRWRRPDGREVPEDLQPLEWMPLVRDVLMTTPEQARIAELENAQLRADCAKWEKMARAAMNVAVDAYDVPSAAQQDKG